MKLVSLYIAAFGGVCDRAFTFGDGISEICLPNGAGKSTLAAFIKVMLFGLAKEGHSLEKNEARLYEPWQGGRFGGTLTFLYEGRLFRIERYFERTGRVKLREELRVIDEATGLVTERFDEEIGRTLFGVDGPSFLRTAYLSSRGISAGKTDDISAKLGGIEGEEADMAAFDRAVALLKDKRREIRTQNTQKNGQKQLDLAERELRGIREEMGAAEAAAERLTVLAADIETKRAHAEGLDLTLASLREERSALDRRLGEQRETERRQHELYARLAEEEEKERTLAAAFPSGVPTRDALDALSKDASEAERLAAELAAMADVPAEDLPDEETLATMRSAVRKRDDLKRKLYDFEKSKPHATENGGRSIRVCFLLAAMVAVLGVASLFLLVPLAIALFALGLCLAAGGTVLLLYAKKGRRAADMREAVLKAQREEYARAEEEAGDLLVRFHLARDAQTADLDALYERCLLARIARARAETLIKAHKESAERLEEALALYPSLPVYRSYTQRVAALRTLAEQLLGRREGVLALKNEIVRLAEEKERKESGTREAPEKLYALLSEAETARAALTAALAEEGREAEECKRLADTLPALLDREAECLCTVRELTEKMETLDKTLEFLLAARASYEEAYLGGIRGHIKTYTDRLLAGKVGEAQLDLDLALSFIENGELREAGYLSTGLLAISDVCLRLALTDSLYPKDPPPLILDDPFATLDEENLAAALALLRELGKERQILYLTCHPSRKALD